MILLFTYYILHLSSQIKELMAKYMILTSTLIMYFFLLLISYSNSASAEVGSFVSVTPSTFQKLQPSEFWQAFTSSSTCRARYLKQQKYRPSSTNIPIFTDYKGALIQLALGTPPQRVHLIMDTASGITWLPCGSNYSCDNCFSWNEQFKDVEIFDPSSSSSSKYVSCNNPKYRVLAGPRVKCKNCKENNSKECLNPALDYILDYANGSTNGLLLSETLSSPLTMVPEVIVGCSSFTKNLPLVGIAGLGRGIISLPAQLGIKKFSYCLSSSLMDVKAPRSYFVLNDNSHSKKLSYTPFYNLKSTDIFQDYYYVTLSQIIVGRRSVKIPREILVPRTNGYGGTVLDSGSTLSLVEESIFEALIREFRRYLGQEVYIRMIDDIYCFNVTQLKYNSLPKLAFRFRSGLEMDLPLANYLMDGEEEKVKCLGFRPKFSGVSLKPAIVLGNMQMRNFHVEYDLENERFGFRANRCK